MTAAGGAPVVILIVDDDPGVLEQARAALADEIAEVVTAKSSLHALQVLQARPVDIVVCGTEAPGLDCVRFLETVAARWPETIRVVSSRNPELGAFVDCVNRGRVRKILVQPMAPAALREQIEPLVNERLAARR